jgi:hypothetical protein
MCKGLIPGLIFYKYNKDDEEIKTYYYENVDGQHRIFVIWHFYLSIPIDAKGTMIYWYYKDENVEQYLFYEENAHTKQWTKMNPDKTVKYMTQEEKTDFRRFTPLHI